MDLENENLASDQSVEETEAVPGLVPDSGRNEVVEDGTGSCLNEGVGGEVQSRGLVVERNENDIRQPSCSPSIGSHSPGDSGGSAVRKGYGLRKWRRIRRDVVRNTSPSIDHSKPQKRGLSTSINPASPLAPTDEDKQRTGDLVGVADASENHPGGFEHFPTQASSSSSVNFANTTYAVGANSDNSEDRSSKSSTAASAPKHGFDMPAVSGFLWDKDRAKDLRGNGLNNMNQKSQIGKARPDTSKKFRGERVIHEKENFHSSMESNSRSSNFVFTQASNGRQSETYNSDEESGEDHPGEPRFPDDQTAHSEVNIPEAEDNSSHEGNEENGGNYQSSTRRDPLVDSLHTLSSAQEALLKEVQKLKEIGSGSNFTVTNPIFDVNPSDYSVDEDLARCASSSLKKERISSAEKIIYLESKLEEARDSLKGKSSKVCELEAALSTVRPHKENVQTEKQEQEAIAELNAEIEILLRQNIEAEVEHIAKFESIQEARNETVDPVTLLHEQKAVVEEQSHLQNRLVRAGCQVVAIKKQAEVLETFCQDIAETENVISQQKNVWQLAKSLLLQLLLLVLLVVLWPLRPQPSSATGGFVPT